MRLAAVLLALIPTLLSPLPTGSAPTGPGDGGPASEARLEFPLGLALGPGGALYVSERRGNRVRRVDSATGVITTVAGTGERGFAGDGGPATKALLACPDSIDVDPAGNLYIADRCNQRIRRVSARSGTITTVAGTGEHEASSDGPVAGASLMGPYYVRVVSPGKLLYTDTDSDRVRLIDLESKRITTLAGSGERGFAGDGGPGPAARLARPHVALFTRRGDLVIGDSFNQRIRRIVHESGNLDTIAGRGEQGVAHDGTPALEAPFGFFGQIHEMDDGDLLFTEWVNGRVLRLDMTERRVHVLAGNTDPKAAHGDGHPPLETRFDHLAGCVIEAEGRLLVAEAEAGLVRRIDLRKGEVVTVVGRPPAD